MLKGGFTAYEDEKVDLIFKAPNTKIETWIDSVSLKSFTKEEWREQQERSINKYRKRDVKIKVTDEAGNALEGANITLTQTRQLFQIGCGTGYSILESKPYQDFFTARFTVATPHNEMKWYYNEHFKGVDHYEVADAMVSFFETKNITVRGHCILWDDFAASNLWVRTLPPQEVLFTTLRRVASVVSRYAGKLAGWDVVNENMHNSYYESILGANASAMIYQITRAIDPHTRLFINEYNVLEYPKDIKVIPSRVVRKIREIRSFPGNEDLDLGIGLQGHFTLRANISYIRAAYDVMGATGSPIWLTELDFQKCPTQHEDLENVLRESFSHPAVEGFIIFGGWKKYACSGECLSYKDYVNLPIGCSQMCLIDNRFNITPTGELVDRLILKEWRSNVVAVTGKDGVFSGRLFHGDYKLTSSHPSIPNPVEKTFKLGKEEGALQFGITLK
ncbi:endo-1,4-beta-xylanase 4-like [Salvia divinorum]|uniref:Endo-1,4-beta-xylanase 4-like n=1 Tax=Salvia divinorum TaxID=28513 RepID=A0ABD1FR78_SALDI